MDQLPIVTSVMILLPLALQLVSPARPTIEKWHFGNLQTSSVIMMLWQHS